MKRNNQPRRKLALRATTLRNLQPPQLAAVGGGGDRHTTNKFLCCTCDIGCPKVALAANPGRNP